MNIYSELPGLLPDIFDIDESAQFYMTIMGYWWPLQDTQSRISYLTRCKQNLMAK